MEENLEAKDWVQWEEVIYFNFYSVLESIIPKGKKLIHEVVHSLSKDVIKQRQPDYLLDIVMAFDLLLVRQCHHPNPLNPGSIWKYGEICWLVGCYSAWALLDSGCHDF